jgi:hypothetical protein
MTMNEVTRNSRVTANPPRTGKSRTRQTFLLALRLSSKNLRPALGAARVVLLWPALVT